MKISELKDKHPSIYKKIVKYHEIQKLTGEPNLELEMVADALNWAKTSEGVDFWHNISLGVTDGFYEMYPEVNQQPMSVTVFDPELDNQVDSLLDGVHGQHRTFESGSVRDNDDDKPLPMELNPYMLIRYGYHMKYGQTRYGDSNWELGQTDVEIWRSMSRHFMQAYMNFKFPNVSKATDDGTDHLSALLFGINMLMHNECNNGVEADKYFKSRK